MINTLPNILTLFRALSSVIIPLLIFFGGDSERLAAVLIFAAASLSDWLDGNIARRLNATTTLGRMLDPIADKLLIAGCLIALIGRDGWGAVLFIPAMMILLREVFVSGLREFMAGRMILHVTPMAKFKTTAQLIAIGLAIAIPITPPAWSIPALTAAALWIAAVMTLWTGGDYFIKAIRHDGKR